MITEQQRTDFAPILAAFALATLDEEGHPEISVLYHDAEGDPVSVFFDSDGTARFETSHLSYILLRTVQISAIAKDARKAAALIDAWQKTHSGRTWGDAADQ